MASRVTRCERCGEEFIDRSRSHTALRCADCRVTVAREREQVRTSQKTAKKGYWTADTLRRKYGWTPEQFEVQLAIQGGSCAICRSDEPGGHGRWHVDHDHVSGNVRGILCSNCNLGIGNVKDDIALLRKMGKYLQDHQSPRA